MEEEIFNCNTCKYFTTKKHIFEKHLKRETHLKKVKKMKCVKICENEICKNEICKNEICKNEICENEICENEICKNDVDVKKPSIENNIVQSVKKKEYSTNIVETTTYSTTNSSTDYDIHIDTGDFIRMMNSSLTELKQTGDKKKFVTGFFDYMFKHVTDVRHFEEIKNENE